MGTSAMTDIPRKDGPRTEAGRRLLAKLDDIGRSPLSGVSFPDAEDDIARIEAEAAAGPRPHPINQHEANCPDCMALIEQQQREYDAATTGATEPRRDDVAGDHDCPYYDHEGAGYCSVCHIGPDDVAGSGEPYQDDIIQAATGGPDFTVKEWPSDDVAGSGERLALKRLVDAVIEEAEPGSKSAVIAFDVRGLVADVDASPEAVAAHYRGLATATRLSSSIDDASTQAPREETPE